MITVTYDPENGLAIPDGKAIAFADSISEDVTVSSFMVIDALRLKAIKGELNDIVLSYGGKEITLDDRGQCSEWPNGFGDHNMYLSRDIMRARREKRENNQK
jgi:hypothetical protein